MKIAWIAAVLVVLASDCLAEAPAKGRYQDRSAYPESEAAAVWRALGAGYVRKALKDKTLDVDPHWNARVDKIMSAVGAAAAVLYPRLAGASWRTVLVDDFGYGAVAFPGGTLIVDARFVRQLGLTDDELALVFAHEVAHVIAGHPLEKLSFMAETLGKDRAPTARSALLEFFAQDRYGALFEPTARLQEREADAIGAVILSRSGFNTQRALELFDKLAKLERAVSARADGTHDSAMERRRSVLEAIESQAQRRGSTSRSAQRCASMGANAP